ncbi:hypothetical protein MMC28_004822 [Mycoblastus sanguinarius]|nr:hypothetical protein [Mycoblastus sanguinarius]
MATTITELMSVKMLSPTHFESTHLPGKMGNMANQAYGGNTLAVAVNAALQTVPPGYFLYSALGNYLSPALIDLILHCTVRSLRTSPTFATRHVEIHQSRPKEQQPRLILFLSADFQTAEPVSLLTYSRSPKMMTNYSDVEDSPTTDEHGQRMLVRGLASPEVVGMQKVLFGLSERFFDRRPCPEGVMAQNLMGMAKKGTPTTQDHLPLPAKTSADYIRCKHALTTPGEHVSALAFIMDMGTSFLPLVHNGQSLAEVGAQSSLEFALRVFVNKLNLNTWLLRELSTVAGGEGRTYTEAQLWDRGGKMVCNMTQQCILRPKVEKTARI